MKNHVAIIASLAIFCPVVLADEAGQLKFGAPKDVSPQSLEFYGQWYAGQDQFIKAPADCGTTHPKAVVAQIYSQSGKSHEQIQVAVDCTQADMKVPDVVRFDFSSKCHFKDAPSLPMKGKMQGDMFTAEFGPQTVTVTINNASVPLTISGHYQKNKNYRYLSITLVLAASGECLFDGKAYPVCVMDSSANFKLGEEGEFGKTPWESPTGDMLLVNERHGFEKPAKAILGQPILVGGKWFTVKFDPVGLKISARPAEFETARIKVDHDRWDMILSGKKYSISVSGGKEPFTIPADTYKVRKYNEEVVLSQPASGSEKQESARRGGLCVYSFSQNGGKTIQAEAGKTVDVAIGSPIQAKLNVNQRGRNMTFSMTCQDAAGQDVTDISLSRGRPEEPVIEVVDASGNTLHKGKLEFG